MARRKRLIELAQKFGLLLLSLCASGLVVETLWRYQVDRRFGPPTTYDEVVGWRYRPNVTSRHRTAAFDIEIRTDGNGRRGAPGGPAEGRPRVVFVGDSVTFGWGNPAEDIFPSLIGRMLDVEVVNLGVSGYGTGQEYLVLRQHGLPLEPSAVVLTFNPNDLMEVVADWKYGWTKPRFRLEGSRLVLSKAGERSPFLERTSSFYRSSRAVLLARSNDQREKEMLPTARRLVRRLIGSMAEESREAGARFFVVHAGNRWLSKTLDEDGIERIDVGMALRAARRAGPVSFENDPHWNARGHQAVAERLRSALEEVTTSSGS
ncbi:MAG: SGNH/GDSL hydrolase family protein [bacterium]|nr:SGNH/GDSL hydrolase family protein [bacterium]